MICFVKKQKCWKKFFRSFKSCDSGHVLAIWNENYVCGYYLNNLLYRNSGVEINFQRCPKLVRSLLSCTSLYWMRAALERGLTWRELAPCSWGSPRRGWHHKTSLQTRGSSHLCFMGDFLQGPGRERKFLNWVNGLVFLLWDCKLKMDGGYKTNPPKSGFERQW